MLELMKQYNVLIEKQQRAIKFFENNPQQLEAHIDRYRKVVNELNDLIETAEQKGYAMTAEEVLEGFKQVRYLAL